MTIAKILESVAEFSTEPPKAGNNACYMYVSVLGLHKYLLLRCFRYQLDCEASAALTR